jgi:hypothetical protein
MIPKNAVLNVYGNGWVCKRGYHRVGNDCVPVVIPKNAVLNVYGNGWVCKRGYHRVGNDCVPVVIPKNAVLNVYGNGWVCKRGYHRVGNDCVPVVIPKNAVLNVYGNGWVCKRGYKLVSGKCVKMTEQEVLEHDRMIAALIRQSRLEQSECSENGEPIEGDRAEVILLKSGCGDYFLADGPSGIYLLEWYGGYSPSEGDVIIGPINSYGFKDVCYPGNGNGRVWVDDYLLSNTSALEKYDEKCN